jgi:hypothetical protein
MSVSVKEAPYQATAYQAATYQAATYQAATYQALLTHRYAARCPA